MVSWTVISSESADRVFTRPLGVTELGFYWDGEFNGTADSLQDAVVETRRSDGVDLFAPGNVYRAWIHMKRHFPLLGSRVDEQNDSSNGNAYFVVEEKKLKKISSEEVSFAFVTSQEDAQRRVMELLNGPRQLSKDLQARVYVWKRTDLSNLFHIGIHASHNITDGMSNMTILRAFLDTVATSSEGVMPIPHLEDRLAMALALEDLAPTVNRSRQRWRRAIAHVLVSNQMSKMTGGHALPRTISPSTPHIPARSAQYFMSLTPENSTSIVANCRKNKITFGHALPILGQVAMTRVLLRLYLRGDISEVEWQDRKTQPMYTGGPINLRPYLDKNWYNNGGAGEVGLSISFFYFTLPFMPLGSALQANFSPGVPPCSALLSADRFFYRCRMVKRQSEKWMKHPLFLDMAAVRTPARVARTKPVAINWREAQRKAERMAKNGDEVVTAGGPVFAFGGSSLGNIQALVRADYPLSSNDPLSPRSRAPHVARAGYSHLPPPPVSDVSSMKDSPVLHLHSSTTYLHCRPTELYLGAATSRGQLRLNVFWDGNVYDDALVEEWLNEVKGVAEWYLADAVDADQRAKL